MTFKDSSTKANVSFNELLKETLVIDKFIDYCVFKNIQFIGSGTFGSTYHAAADMSDIGVALKSFENIDMITAKEILNEINLYKDIMHDNFIKFYGVTKNEGSQYLLVLEYAGDGTITTYLRNTFNKLNWERKLNLAQQLVNGKLSELMVDILDGVREKFIEGTPISYAILYTDCWQKDPKKRPNIQDVVLSFEQLKTESIHNENKAIKNNLFSVNELPETSNTIQSDLDQLTHNNKKLVMEDDNLDLDSLNSKDSNSSQDFYRQIVKELCDLYNEERMKGKYILMIYDLMDQFFKKKQQKPEFIINWCLNNQENPLWLKKIFFECMWSSKKMSRPKEEVKHMEIKEQVKDENRKFKFTHDWLKPHLPYWEKNLFYLKNQKINVLEIGAFEGRSTTWILEELFKNPESKLITIDIFLKIFPDNDNETTFHENIKKTRKENQIEVIKSKSFNTLIKLNHENKLKFDFIYIDGSHESHDVLSDAVLSWNLLKEGGIMILDDYEWDFFEEEYLNPRIAIDSFLRCYQAQIEIIDKYYQVAIRKITREGTRTVREGKTID
ncbi:20604_t:CDS:2 [Cetraspora pellucida]|uniref:20604_t:CDS:1 n=1 Tax=Cetraspora pellucida TaxID=1433469 RepID=A0A9N9NNP1_9GLOM|nr:20604_t:CDS:2 [Cetraspora pellucida]